MNQHWGLLELRGHESSWDGPRCRWGMAQLELACGQRYWSAALPMRDGVGGDAHALKHAMVLLGALPTRLSLKLGVLPAAAPWGQLRRGALRPAKSSAEAPGSCRWAEGGGLRMGADPLLG